MKQITVLSLVTLLLATGCPPPEPDPDPMPVNSFTFRNNVPNRIVTEFRMGFGSPSMGYAYGPNLLSTPLLNGTSIIVEDLRVGIYQLKATSIPIGLGSPAVTYYDWGEIAIDSQALISFSAMYP
jgi:hypothetical protein